MCQRNHLSILTELREHAKAICRQLLQGLAPRQVRLHRPYRSCTKRRASGTRWGQRGAWVRHACRVVPPLLSFRVCHRLHANARGADFPCLRCEDSV